MDIIIIIGGLFIILFFAMPLAKRTIRRFNLSPKLLALFYLLFWVGGSAVWVGGVLFYYNIIDPKLNEMHYKNFTEEKAQKAIDNFKSNLYCYADCDSVIFMFNDSGDCGYLIPRDSIIEKYRKNRNFEFYKIKSDKFLIVDTVTIENLVCDIEKLNQHAILSTSINGVYFKERGAISLKGYGYMYFDSYILNTTTKPIKKIMFRIKGLSKEFYLELTTNKQNSFQNIRKLLDKDNTYFGFGIDYEIKDVIFVE